MTPEVFVSRLEAISNDRAQLYGRLLPLFQAQQAHASTSANYKGFVALASAWKCFFFETVEKINTDIGPKVTAPMSDQYPMFIERLAQYFHGLCASEVTANAGYPLQAYTLLRNVFDSAILTSAVAQGKTDFYRLEGLDIAGQFDPAMFRKLRRKEENSVRPLMTGKESGLSDGTIAELVKWDVLFDDETHGGLLSRAYTTDWLKGTHPLPVLPAFDETRYGNFLNRFCEIAWMVHRMLPLVQPRGISFSAEWKGKWKTLDDCFLETANALAVQMSKPIGKAMMELLSSKFPFDQNSVFWR